MFKPYPKGVQKKLKQPSISQLDAKLWKVFSEYIRRKDTDSNGIARCVTCGKFGHWKEMQCGHFISRRHLSTKFDEKNNGVQCEGCNLFNQGKQYEYSRYIDKKYGPGTANDLLIKSKQPSKFTRFDYEYKIKEYKEKLKNLK